MFLLVVWSPVLLREREREERLVRGCDRTQLGLAAELCWRSEAITLRDIIHRAVRGALLAEPGAGPRAALCRRLAAPRSHLRARAWWRHGAPGRMFLPRVTASPGPAAAAHDDKKRRAPLSLLTHATTPTRGVWLHASPPPGR